MTERAVPQLVLLESVPALAFPSTTAYIMTQKYVEGLLLARQEKILARE